MTSATAHANGNGRALAVLSTYASEHRGTCATCPHCGMEGKIRRRRAGVNVFTCDGERGGCTGSGDYLSAEPPAAPVERTADPLALAAELGELLGLEPLGLEVHGARVFGRGSRASVDLDLSDGTTVTFDALRDMANPTRLSVELAACVGAAPKLKQPQAMRAVILVRAIAKHHETLTADEIAIDWGASYLQAANVVDLDMDDQTERWGAFCTLREREPRDVSYEQSLPLARANTVLRNSGDGTRFVRCGWFRQVVKSQDSSITPQELGHRMERVGWRRRGTSGRIKATRPGHADSLLWTFYLVPADWEDTAAKVNE